jgi:membrane dipeptidase
MKTNRTRLMTVSAILVLMAAAGSGEVTISERARRLHARAIVVDGHSDTPQRMVFDKFDLAHRDGEGHVDIPRLREGGIDAPFFSIFVPSTVTGPIAVKRALQQIDAVREQARRHPSDLVLATTADDVRRAHGEGRIAALMGVEGGHMIDDDMGVLRLFSTLGVRYMTLTHFLNNNWSDSSTDKPRHDGLTAFGKDVVREMNRLGMVVDISHVSDKTFYDALAVTRAPVMASHSSCRALSDHPRNMDDGMLSALAKNGGVILINYEASFLSQPYRDAMRSRDVTSIEKRYEEHCQGNVACQILTADRENRQQMKAGTRPAVRWEAIVDHIDHAVKLAGADHVGLGSDFDGATMPLGMEDASMVPKITQALVDRGYSDAAIEKILGGNILRVMEAAERVSREMGSR